MGIRKDRLADEIRDIVALSFTSGNIRDPRLESVVVTSVKLSADLQLASIYFRVMREAFVLEKVQQGLESASGLLRKKLAEGLDVRRIPQLRFFYDESIEHGARIEELLAKLDK